MSERRNDLEITIESPQIASQIPNSDRSPLYDVRNPARIVRRTSVRSDVSRTICIGRGFFKVQASARLRSVELRRAHFASSPAWQRHAEPNAKRGGARRDRTDDLMLAKHALSQLSYGPVTRRRMRALLTLAFAKATAQQPSYRRAS